MIGDFYNYNGECMPPGSTVGEGTGIKFPTYPAFPEHVPAGVHKNIRVDKRTHRVRFESETENEVTIVIEPKEAVT